VAADSIPSGGGGPAPTAATGVDASRRTPDALRLQILATEHWSLLASRALAWNESCAGTFLSILSGAVVALALVAQASKFGNGFYVFALVILPIVLYVGITTLLRLEASNYHDVQCVTGMNRIRGAYLEMAPDLERYFVMSPHDDARGVGVTMVMNPNSGFVAHALASTSSVIIVLDAVLGGAIGYISGRQAGFGNALAGTTAAAGFFVVLALLGLFARRSIATGRASLRPIFPSPELSSPDLSSPASHADTEDL
jgi:hypothetical protein